MNSDYTLYGKFFFFKVTFSINSNLFQYVTNIQIKSVFSKDILSII